MDASVPVDSRVFMQKRALRKCLADNGLTDVVKPGGRHYTLKHGKVLVEAISAGIEPLEFRRKVEREMTFNLVVHDPDALFNIMEQQRRDQAVIEANDAARRQTATRRDARSVAAAGPSCRTMLLTNTTEARVPRPLEGKQTGTVGKRTTSVLFVASKVTSNGTAPKAGRARRGKAFMARATARPPSSSSNPQAVPLSIPGVKPPGRPLRLPPLRLELVGTRPPQKRWLREPNLLRLRRLR